MNENCMHEEMKNHIRSCECHLVFDPELCLPVCCLKCVSYVLDHNGVCFCMAVKLLHTGKNVG